MEEIISESLDQDSLASIQASFSSLMNCYLTFVKKIERPDVPSEEFIKKIVRHPNDNAFPELSKIKIKLLLIHFQTPGTNLGLYEEELGQAIHSTSSLIEFIQNKNFKSFFSNKHGKIKLEEEVTEERGLFHDISRSPSSFQQKLLSYVLRALISYVK